MRSRYQGVARVGRGLPNRGYQFHEGWGPGRPRRRPGEEGSSDALGVRSWLMEAVRHRTPALSLVLPHPRRQCKMRCIVKRVAVAVLLLALLGMTACGGDKPTSPAQMYDGRPLSYWIDSLRKGSHDHGLAVDALSALGPSAVPDLLDVFQRSEDYLQRVRAAGTLGNIGSGMAREVEAAQSGDARQAAEAAVSGIVSALQAVADADLPHLSGTAEGAIKMIAKSRVAAQIEKKNEGSTKFEQWVKWYWEQADHPRPGK